MSDTTQLLSMLAAFAVYLIYLAISGYVAHRREEQQRKKDQQWWDGGL